MTCEHCSNSCLLPLDAVLRYEIICPFCGNVPRSDADQMHRATDENSTELWPAFFIFGGFEKFEVDFESVTEEECEAIATVGDFVDLVESRFQISIRDRIMEIPQLKSFASIFTLEELLGCRLADLARMRTEERKKREGREK